IPARMSAQRIALTANEHGYGGFSKKSYPRSLRGSAAKLLSVFSLKLNLRRLHIQQWSKLINISVAVSVQRDVCREVEGCGHHLGGKGLLITDKVIVAVNQYPRILVRQGALQAVDRDVGKAQVDRTLDMQLVEFLGTAGIENDGSLLAAHQNEFIFRQTA